MTEVAYVALGSNLGDRAAYLAMARAQLSLLPLARVIAASRVEETAPLGALAQAPYLNQMVALRTGYEPLALLGRLQAIERSLGRVRTTRWGSRTIDLDIVCYGTREYRSPRLVLPHSGMAQREFWRREAVELASLLGPAA